MALSQRLATHQLGIIFISLTAVTLVLYPAGLDPGPGLNRAQEVAVERTSHWEEGRPGMDTGPPNSS